MIAINEIRQIAQKMQASGLGKIEISSKDFTLRLHCADSGQNVAVVRPIKALKSGIFLTTHPMQSQPAVASGDRVKAGDCLGFLQAGGLLLPINSPRDGEITRLAVNNRERVGRGRVLFSIRPALVS